MKYTAKVLVAALLLSLAAWLYFIARQVPQEVGSGVGVGLIFFGTLELLLSKRNSRLALSRIEGKASRAARLWEALGKSGVEFLFTGIGVVLIAAGAMLLMRARL